MTEVNEHLQLPLLIDIETLAKQLGTSVRHIRRLRAKRRIPCHKVGGRLRFDPVEILAWLEEQRRPAMLKRTRG